MSRLDIELVARGLAPSREIAKKLINNSLVYVDDTLILKPSHLITIENKIEVKDNFFTKYVSRGAFKLEKALDFFSIDVNSLTAVDFGASTGGFTDLLLQRGANKVYAIENGYGQLHEKLISDPRVVSLENTNARFLKRGDIPLCDIAVMDVSFISQVKLYESVTKVLKNGGIFISLIKPQFEAGKSALNKKGIVKNQGTIDKVVDNIELNAKLYGFNLIGITESPILGGDGNKELLACFKFKEE